VGRECPERFGRTLIAEAQRLHDDVPAAALADQPPEGRFLLVHESQYRRQGLKRIGRMGGGSLVEKDSQDEQTARSLCSSCCPDKRDRQCRQEYGQINCSAGSE